jgi:hypothetical protein
MQVNCGLWLADNICNYPALTFAKAVSNELEGTRGTAAFVRALQQHFHHAVTTQPQSPYDVFIAARVVFNDGWLSG